MINICFHGVGRPGRAMEHGEPEYWISVELFTGVLDLVAGRSDVALSFDDGNASDAEIALPLLQERGLSASFFVLAGRFDRPGSLSTAQVEALVGAGMPIGSHGMHHVPWRGLDAAARTEELVTARTQIQAVVGGPVDQAALPLGRYDRSVLRALREAGYSRVFSSDRRPARAGAWLQPRFSVRRGDDVADVRSFFARPPATTAARAAAVGLLKRVR